MTTEMIENMGVEPVPIDLNTNPEELPEELTRILTEPTIDPLNVTDVADQTGSAADVVTHIVDVFTNNTETIFGHIADLMNGASKYLSPDILAPYLEKIPFLTLFPHHTYAAMLFIVIVSFAVWREGCLAKWLFSVSLVILAVMLGLDVANYFIT